jgi:hypothetical protein
MTLFTPATSERLEFVCYPASRSCAIAALSKNQINNVKPSVPGSSPGRGANNKKRIKHFGLTAEVLFLRLDWAIGQPLGLYWFGWGIRGYGEEYFDH